MEQFKELQKHREPIGAIGLTLLILSLRKKPTYNTLVSNATIFKSLKWAVRSSVLTCSYLGLVGLGCSFYCREVLKLNSVEEFKKRFPTSALQPLIDKVPKIPFQEDGEDLDKEFEE